MPRSTAGVTKHPVDIDDDPLDSRCARAGISDLKVGDERGRQRRGSDHPELAIRAGRVGPTSSVELYPGACGVGRVAGPGTEVGGQGIGSGPRTYHGEGAGVAVGTRRCGVRLLCPSPRTRRAYPEESMGWKRCVR